MDPTLPYGIPLPDLPEDTGEMMWVWHRGRKAYKIACPCKPLVPTVHGPIIPTGWGDEFEDEDPTSVVRQLAAKANCADGYVAEPSSNDGWSTVNPDKRPVEVSSEKPIARPIAVMTSGYKDSSHRLSGLSGSSRGSRRRRHHRRGRKESKEEKQVDETLLVSMDEVLRLSKMASASPDKPSLHETQAEIRQLQQYTRQLDQRIARLEKGKATQLSNRGGNGKKDQHHRYIPVCNCTFDCDCGQSSQFHPANEEGDGLTDQLEAFQLDEPEGDHMASTSSPMQHMFVGAMTHHAQKWVTRLTVRVRDMVHDSVYANFDSGSDFNCIRADLVPAKFWKKCGEQASAVDGSYLETQWMVRNIHIRKNGQSVAMDFIKGSSSMFYWALPS